MSVKFVVQTQAMENYGAHAENGKHEDGNAYWKFKGGDTYIVEGTERVQDAVAAVMAYVHQNVAWKEFPVKWEDYAHWRKGVQIRKQHNDDANTLEHELYRAVTIDVNNPAGEQYMNGSAPWVWEF